MLDGAATGQTQTALAAADDGGSSGSGELAALWEHPVDVHFSCASLTGWPQLLVTLWRQDSMGRNEVCGYGGARIPACSGLHQLELACWRPEGSLLQEVSAAFLGGGLPHLTDSTMVAHPEGRRHAIATSSAGVVSVELNVLCKGFAERGVLFAEE